MLDQLTLSSDRFNQLVASENFALVIFVDRITQIDLDNIASPGCEDFLHSLILLCGTGASVFLITGGNSESLSSVRNIKDIICLTDYGLTLRDGLGIHVMKQAEYYRDLIQGVYNRLQIWLPAPLTIENRGVSIALNYSEVSDYRRAEKGLVRLLEEADCIDRFNLVKHRGVMQILPPLLLQGNNLVQQLGERYKVNNFVLIGLNYFDHLISNSVVANHLASVTEPYNTAMKDVKYSNLGQHVRVTKFDGIEAGIQSLVSAITAIRLL